MTEIKRSEMIRLPVKKLLTLLPPPSLPLLRMGGLISLIYEYNSSIVAVICPAVTSECRRRTTIPPEPEITLRSMTSRSTVTQSAGRDVDSAYQSETPPASAQCRDVRVTERKHCRQRDVNVTVYVMLNNKFYDI